MKNIQWRQVVSLWNGPSGIRRSRTYGDDEKIKQKVDWSL